MAGDGVAPRGPGRWSRRYAASGCWCSRWWRTRWGCDPGRCRTGGTPGAVRSPTIASSTVTRRRRWTGRPRWPQRFAGELVDDVEQLQRAPIGGDVGLEVARPQRVWSDRAHRPDVRVDPGQPLLLHPLGGLQALLTPLTTDPLVVDLPASTPRDLRGTAGSSPARASTSRIRETRPSVSARPCVSGRWRGCPGRRPSSLRPEGRRPASRDRR